MRHCVLDLFFGSLPSSKRKSFHYRRLEPFLEALISFLNSVVGTR